jgi:hypothetical protein
MRKGARQFGMVLVLLLLWELAWLAIIIVQSRCSGGTCVLDKDLSLVFQGVSLIVFIAVFIFRSHLGVPRSWDTAIFIALAVQVVGALDVWNEQTVDGRIPTTEVSIDNVVMIVALFLACLWWFTVERRSSAKIAE